MKTATGTPLPTLPAGLERLRIRAYAGPADHPALADLYAATNRADGVAERTSAEVLDVWFGQPRNMEPVKDIILVEAPDGRIVASAIVRWIDRNTTGERSFEQHCDVRPELRRRGIGRALLEWQTARIAAIAATMPDLDGRPAIKVGYVMEADTGGHVLLEAAGYRVVRRSAELIRPDLLGIPTVPTPAGIVLRSIDPADEEMVRRVWHVTVEVFSGHWGDPAQDTSDASWRRFRDNPDVQPDHWCVAFDGDEVVGHILAHLTPDDDGATVGWTEGIAVREGWRRRGIARAMLAWSLRHVRKAGATRAGLGVDVQNPNQALGLYESMGFGVTAQELEYHRPLRIP